MNNPLRLFHTTNEYAYDCMRQSGFIGLDMTDYRKLTNAILERTNMPHGTLDAILKSIQEDDEANGSVSFFPTKKQCIALIPNYCSGGEWKENVVQQSLKRIARLQKCRYHEYRDIYEEFTGCKSCPVILEVHLPVEWIANTHVLGSKKEHYTIKKVPLVYIKKVHRYV